MQLSCISRVTPLRRVPHVSVVLENLVKRYIGPDGSVVPVVDVGYFRLDDAEQVALIGTSGSGKTTLLHLIAGILTPDRGRIVFDLRESGCLLYTSPSPRDS